MKVLITSGGTKIPIDSVRSIRNMSSGTFGSRIASCFISKLLDLENCELTFLMAKNSKTPFSINENIFRDSLSHDRVSKEKLLDCINSSLLKYKEVEYETFDDYSRLLKEIISTEKPDIVILAAAVSDYGIENQVNGKIRSNDDLTIKLKKLPKLINSVKDWSKNSILVGFKLLVNSTDNELIDAAKKSIEENRCDLVIANDLKDIKNDNHKLKIIDKNNNIFVYEKSYYPDDNLFLAKMVMNHSILKYKEKYE